MATKRKVLIVEDEFILYNQLSEFFEEKGYEIIGHEDESAVDSYDDALQLLKANAPDIAILDINLNGKKDGLELAAYIKEHFYSLIIILTAYDNHENLERARLLSPDGFVVKVDKPVDKKQLWATISIRLPKLYSGDMRKTQGSFLKVREIDTAKQNGKKTPDIPVDPLDIETFIKWENITYIESYNAKSGEGNNNILIHTTTANTGYIYRSSLSEMERKLPLQFVRFDQATIVNMQHVTAKKRGQSVYFIGTQAFRISDKYRDFASDKIDDFFS